MKLLWKLLRCHLSPAQLVGFALAGVVGMTILLTSWQAYRDIRPLLTAPDAIVRGDFLVLSKRVGTLQTLGLGSTDFAPAEIADLEAQPFVRAVGAFTPADYRIAGSVGAGGMRFSTYLFFESVPDRFLDIRPGEWHYEAGSREVPIIIPRNYVNLYNYGFARSQGLPQLSEGLFRHVGIDLEIEGDGRRENFRGRIVGLSNRLNTILVPESFIRWSNEHFGRGEAGRNPARVIVETAGPVDAAVTEYLAARGYEIEGDVRDGGRAARMLRLAAGGVAGIGLLFSVMAVYVLMLSLFLVLQRSSDRVRDLLDRLCAAAGGASLRAAGAGAELRGDGGCPCGGVCRAERLSSAARAVAGGLPPRRDVAHAAVRCGTVRPHGALRRRGRAPAHRPPAPRRAAGTARCVKNRARRVPIGEKILSL